MANGPTKTGNGLLPYIGQLPLHRLHSPFFDKAEIKVSLLRADLTDAQISGNKWFKLTYNLQEAQRQGHDTLLTFGGAFSNHIVATAAAAKRFGFKSIGLIRGEEHEVLNPVLAFAQNCGMELHYLDRGTYRLRHQESYLESLANRFGRHYLIPEGGTNFLAMQGCKLLVTDALTLADHICLPVGTGGTMAGIIAGLNGKSHVTGFLALKGADFLAAEIIHLLDAAGNSVLRNWELQTNFHFGGYAKTSPELLAFIETFKIEQGVILDPIYTGKMMFGLYELAKNAYFAPGSSVIAIHTGGLPNLDIPMSKTTASI